MSAELIVIAALVFLLGAAVLVLALGFRFTDLVLTAAALFPIAWLSRFDATPVFVVGQHVPLHWLVLLPLAILLFPFGRGPTRRFLGPPMLPVFGSLAVLLLLMFASIIANGRDVTDVLTGIRAMCYVVFPIAAAWSVIRIVRFDQPQLQRLTLVLYGVGVLVAAISALSALNPALFGAVVQSYKTEADTGRAFSTLGGANLTGTVILLVAAVAAGNLISRVRPALSAIVLALCFLGLLTTLARAVLLAFLLVILFLLARRAPGRVRRAVALGGVALFVLIPIAWKLSQSFSLERFVLGVGGARDTSVESRRTSLETAVRYGVEHPVLGGGWGLLYPWARTVRIVKDLPRVWYVDGRPSLVKPHNLFALVLAESGLLALAALLVFLWQIWRALRPPDARLDPRGSGIVSGYRAAFLGFVFMSCFQDDLFIASKASFLLYLVFFTGILTAAYYRAAASARVAAALRLRAAAAVPAAAFSAAPVPQPSMLETWPATPGTPGLSSRPT